MAKQRTLNREKKQRLIDELKEIISGCSTAVFTDYRGLSTAELTQLRRKLRESDVRYRVVKNTLARFAAQSAGKESLLRFFEGPVAIAFGYGEETVPSKALVEYIRATKVELGIKGGFIGSRLLTAAEVTTLARLPSREVLLAMVMAGMQSPITSLVGILSSPMRGFLGVLQARIKQLEGE